MIIVWHWLRLILLIIQNILKYILLEWSLNSMTFHKKERLLHKLYFLTKNNLPKLLFSYTLLFPPVIFNTQLRIHLTIILKSSLILSLKLLIKYPKKRCKHLSISLLNQLWSYQNHQNDLYFFSNFLFSIEQSNNW
jgi:hypothetical protein